MSRIESLAIAGYYPTPPHLIDPIAGLVAVPKRRANELPHYHVADPCAGDGAAIYTLARRWFPQGLYRSYQGPPAPDATLYVAEMEGDRARRLAEGAGRFLPAAGYARGSRVEVASGDAFNLALADRHRALSALYLNPPYHELAGGDRLERRFLARFGPTLVDGGALIFVIPVAALPGCAVELATICDRAACWRFPAVDFAAYGQVVVVGRRATVGDLIAPEERDLAATVRSWAADPLALPVLGSATAPFLILPTADGFGPDGWRLREFDLVRFRTAARPGMRTVGRRATSSRWLGLERPILDLQAAPRVTATTLTPAHVVLALAAGLFDGAAIAPDDPASGLPPVYIRGTFRRERVRTGEERDARGALVSYTETEEPSLALCVLDLVGATYHTLRPGDQPTGATTLADFTNADLLAAYKENLLRHLTSRCRPKYDPGDPEQHFPLPEVGLVPFRVQAHTARTVLTQIGLGERALVPGEVGTGKTLVTLLTLWALGPRNFARTREGLAGLGLDRLGLALDPAFAPVRTALVLMPTHLLSTWAEEARRVLPGAETLVLDRIGDIPGAPPVDNPGDVRPGAGLRLLLLSKETAKLGHEQRGATGLAVAGPRRGYLADVRVCPRCGAAVPDQLSDEQLARRRYRCQHRRRVVGPLQRALAELATSLATIFPHNQEVRQLTEGRVRRRYLARVAESRPPGLTEQQIWDATADPERAVVSGLRDELLMTAWHLLGPANLVEALVPHGQSTDGEVADCAESGALSDDLARLLPAIPFGAVADVGQTAFARALRGYVTILAAPGEVGDTYLHTRALAQLVGSLPLTIPGRDTFLCDLIRHVFATCGGDWSGLEYAPGHGPARACRDAARELLLQVQDTALRDATYDAIQALEPRRAAYGSGAADAATWRREADIAARHLALARSWQGREIDSDSARAAVAALPGNARVRIDNQTLALRAGVVEIGSVAEAAEALRALLAGVKFGQGAVCDEPLYTATTTLRRYPLAKYIRRRRPDCFDLLVIDESQDYRNEGTAQTFAVHRLGAGSVPLIELSGSISNGRASSMFTNLWLLDAGGFRAAFGRHERGRFADIYGYRRFKYRVDDDGPSRAVEYGHHSDRREDGEPAGRDEAPGIVPTLMFDHVLQVTAPMRKADLDIDLPAKEEVPLPIHADQADPHDRALLERASRLFAGLLARIRQDAFSANAGKLLGALGEAESFLDRCTADVGDGHHTDGFWRVAYPQTAEGCGGQAVVDVPLLPASWCTPKERWLVAFVAEELARGRACLVLLKHTGQGQLLVKRLQRILGEAVGARQVAFLDAQKVDARRRKDWIDRHVVGRGVKVLLVNPLSVSTGLNNLVAFATAILYQNPNADAIVYRQAFGRIDRPGQTRPPRMVVPYYAATAQEHGFALLVEKVNASLQADGIDISSALGAVGGARGMRGSGLHSFGQALFALLEEGRATERVAFAASRLFGETSFGMDGVVGSVPSGVVAAAAGASIVPVPLSALPPTRNTEAAQLPLADLRDLAAHLAERRHRRRRRAGLGEEVEQLNLFSYLLKGA